MVKVTINVHTVLYGLKCTLEPIEIEATPKQAMNLADFFNLPKDEQQRRLEAVMLK